MTRSDEIARALAAVRAGLPSGATLIVVTKTFPVSDLEILYQLGEREFGENRDEEGAGKALALPSDISWHFQGAIQSKKIRSIVQWADYIHSVDELRHAEKINQCAAEINKRMRIFIQVNLEAEHRQGRSGIAPEELTSFARNLSILPAIEVLGLMCVAPLGEDPEPAFARLAALSKALQEVIPGARFISAGMSGDYQIALRYGATHIRVGSSILGSR